MVFKKWDNSFWRQSALRKRDPMSEDLKSRIALVFRAEVAETGFNHVSVVHLMKKSGIRRQTFYDNFQDKYDLLGYTI